MNALITGINGFVGQHLAEYLKTCGDHVLGTSLNPAENSGKIVAWDISQPASAALIQSIDQFRPDVIYHLAAISHPGSCGDDLPTETCQAVNIVGTRNIADLALESTSRPKVIFVSSSKVYGPRTPDNPIANEQDPPNPRGGYAHSKWAAENVLLDRTSQGLNVVIARAFNHTGPGQTDMYVVPEWCQKIASGNSPQKIGSLKTSLDLSDVRDVVQIYRKLAEQGQSGEIYNVGSGISTTTGDIWNALCNISGKPIEAVAANQDISQQPIANLTKLNAAIGPIERIPLQRTLRDVYENATA